MAPYISAANNRVFQPDSRLVVPSFQKGDDPIDAIKSHDVILDAVGRHTFLCCIGTTRKYTYDASWLQTGKPRTVIVTIAKEGSYCKKPAALSLKRKGMRHAKICSHGQISKDVWIRCTPLRLSVLKILLSKKSSGVKPQLYDGNTILKMDPIEVPDSDETKEQSEKSRSKMILKEQDPLFEKYKVNTKPINYAILNNDYYKRFVRQTDLYSEHAYWKATSVPALDHLFFNKPLSKKEPLPQLSLRARGGVRLSTCASGSQPSGTTKKDRILQAPSSNSKNKVEAHPRNVKSSSNKKNGTVNVSGSAVVQNLKKQDNSDCVGINSNDCMSSDNVSDLFTIVGNACPLTRITTTNEVPSRKPIVLDSKSPKPVVKLASKTKSWLWHRRLSHLNFGSINHLARHGLVRGLPKLKFEKDHLCSACALGKSSKKPHKTKSEDTNQEKLYLLHMDLCGPMRVASVSGKKYILVIVDDYSRFTWVKCLRSKDEAPVFIINFLKMIQVRLKETVRRIRTDNGTEFVNQTLHTLHSKTALLKDEIVR
ncbi:retrovirus-related pol polyprotein from transposon TNT 1-94 [Tanacetum coccineum]